MSIVNLRPAIPLLLGAALVSGCGPSQQANSGSPGPSATPTEAATASPSPTPSAGGTAIVEATVSPYAAKGGPIIEVTASPLATPVAQSVALPTPGSSGASPAPTTTPEPELALALPPNAPPKILKVALSKTTVHGGDVVSGYVQTSSNVASVELRIAGYSLSMPKTGTGRFELSYAVPNLPFFLHRTYPMNIIARNTRGDETTANVPITVR